MQLCRPTPIPKRIKTDRSSGQSNQVSVHCLEQLKLQIKSSVIDNSSTLLPDSMKIIVSADSRLK